MFAALVEQEDPDLLDWFMEVSEPPRPEMKTLIQKLKLCTDKCNGTSSFST